KIRKYLKKFTVAPDKKIYKRGRLSKSLLNAIGKIEVSKGVLKPCEEFVAFYENLFKKEVKEEGYCESCPDILDIINKINICRDEVILADEKYVNNPPPSVKSKLSNKLSALRSNILFRGSSFSQEPACNSFLRKLEPLAKRIFEKKDYIKLLKEIDDELYLCSIKIQEKKGYFFWLKRPIYNLFANCAVGNYGDSEPRHQGIVAITPYSRMCRNLLLKYYQKDYTAASDYKELCEKEIKEDITQKFGQDYSDKAIKDLEDLMKIIDLELKMHKTENK
ncbi:hypothetical protein HZB88_02090, partial [archaeon]|nr:hypothetical protein [archaeon]